ncbi:MAG: signal peptidase I [Bacilli bacterium]|nr:signal peptidase I [Bacilli bacterium]
MRNNFVIYGLLIVYFFLNTFVLIPMNLTFYNELINPILWIIMCGIAVYLSHDSNLRIKGERDKTQSLLIALIIYIIVYFLLGLVFGFERTPYSKEIFSILKNLWSFVGIIFFQEFIREALIKNEKKKIINYFLIIILFSLLNINFSNFFNHFSDLQTSFTYVSSVLLPTILESALLTYLVYIGGVKFGLIYRTFVEVPPFIVPILPDLDWFGTALVGIALPLSVYVYLNYVHINRTERLSKREKRKYNPAVYIPVFVFIGLIAGFVIGLFKYQPIAVISGSMSPTFNRGDAVVVKKLNEQEKQLLKNGDIIQFVSGSKYVVHRIVEVTNDDYGSVVFITKGDHNNTIDVDKVHIEDVKGKVSFTIPFIGYPSVWLSGAIS